MLGMKGWQVRIDLILLIFLRVVSENHKSYFTPLDPLRDGVLSPSACWLRGFAYGAPKFLPQPLLWGALRGGSGSLFDTSNVFHQLLPVDQYNWLPLGK